jgi:hypothetical protein
MIIILINHLFNEQEFPAGYSTVFNLDLQTFGSSSAYCVIKKVLPDVTVYFAVAMPTVRETKCRPMLLYIWQ